MQKTRKKFAIVIVLMNVSIMAGAILLTGAFSNPWLPPFGALALFGAVLSITYVGVQEGWVKR